MSSKHRHDPDQDHLTAGYERMLQRLREQFAGTTDGGPRLEEALEGIKQRMIDSGELAADEAEHVARSLLRDLREAGAWLADRSHQHPLRDWLRMDLQMLESWLWEAFSSVADRTSMELRGFVTTGEPSLYHTGEIAGPGELRCIACGRTVHFTRPGHIPPCPACNHTEFVRAPHTEDTSEPDDSDKA
ncbi:MAG: zinc ribbon-containing protein [Halorhodospira sp.]